ncbi:MAG: response regulator, partial [Spirochaetales bacterium]|nr:response regulator [Spirochaetales bacterium]
MLKVLLVDDEEIIKSGLRNEVNWESAGCLVAGEASDGQEALDLIRQDPPDVVISDIRMPFKDGLDLMEEARALYPDLFFLFISGHDEFSYVQRALKMGASDYLLKPIDTVYLEQSLSKIAGELGSRSRNRAAGEISRRAEVRSFLQKIIFTGLQDEAALREEAVQLDPELPDKTFQILSFQIDHYYSYGGLEDDQDQENIRKAFYELIRNFDPDHSALLTESLREFDLCLMSD